MIRLAFKYLLFPAVVLISWSCAQQGMPTGGPKDEDPPAVLDCNPANYSILFASNKIQITFDEYIVLDNVSQQLIVSPPMEEQPLVKLKKKSIIIEFEETLRANTTYTFNFGDAIKDLHEGNKLQNYEYVFSTGEVLDSMSIRGNLRYAESLKKPEEPVSILIYSDLRDSVPLTDIPIYVGRSNDSGVFSVNNLRPDIYKVFALKDANNNFLFDIPTEEIAFLDSSLILTTDFVKSMMRSTEDGQEADSISTTPGPVPSELPELPELPDSTSLVADSLLVDSLRPPAPDYTSIYIDLMLFTEESDLQYIMDYTREDRRKLDLAFALPLSDSFAYSFLSNDGVQPEYLEHFSKERDSLTFWIIDSTDYMMDSLFMALNFTVLDSMEQEVLQHDTLLFSFRDKTKKSKGKKEGDKEEEKPVEMLGITTIKTKGTQELNTGIPFTLGFPLAGYEDSLVSLYHIPDTIEIAVPFELKADTKNPLRAWLIHDWESASNYRLQVLPGTFTSLYPLGHDTIDVRFASRDTEHYGQILLNMEGVRDRVIIQLLAGEKIVSERTVEADGTYSFPYLQPKDYSFKFIHDRNGNGKWDTGSYLEKEQPEDVELLQKKISVRSNWDHEATMVLKK